MFTRYIQVLEGIAMHPCGATCGAIQKTCLTLTRGQVQRTCRELISEGFLKVEKVPYKGTIEKTVYHIEEKAAEYCGYIVKKYEMLEVQLMLNLEVQ